MSTSQKVVKVLQAPRAVGQLPTPAAARADKPVGGLPSRVGVNSLWVQPSREGREHCRAFPGGTGSCEMTPKALRMFDRLAIVVLAGVLVWLCSALISALVRALTELTKVAE